VKLLSLVIGPTEVHLYVRRGRVVIDSKQNVGEYSQNLVLGNLKLAQRVDNFFISAILLRLVAQHTVLLKENVFRVPRYSVTG
jgi:hypothetical protein